MMLERQGVVFVEVAFFFRLLVLKLLVTCFLNCQVGLAKITFAKCGFSILTPVANHKSIWTSISGASKHGYIFLKHQKRGMIPSILAVPLANFQGLGVVSPTYNGSSIKPLQGGKPTSYKWGYVTLANHLDHLVSAIYCGKITPLITGSARGPQRSWSVFHFPKSTFRKGWRSWRFLVDGYLFCLPSSWRMLWKFHENVALKPAVFQDPC